MTIDQKISGPEDLHLVAEKWHHDNERSWRHDTQHNDIQHNNATVSITALRFISCYVLFIVIMVNDVAMLKVFMLSAVGPN